MMAAKYGVPKKKRTTRFRHAPDPDPPPPPPNARRSLRPRRRRPLAGDYFDDDYDVGVDDDLDEEDESRRRLKLVLRLPPGHVTSPIPHVAPSQHSRSSSDGEEEDEEEVMPTKKRRIDNSEEYSDGSGHREVSSPGARLTSEKRRNVVKRTISGTLLQEKTLLLEVLDKLQKKDTYSVFARPVDPDELPDYHDVIEHPMDFGTVRRKLAGGVYPSFEQFEDDVFLICSNAMQYNAPDTIYFRQAHSIQDMARKKFQELRADTIFSGAARKTEEKTSFNTVKKKILKKPQYRSASELLRPNMSSMEKIIKKPHCRTAPDRHGSDLPSMEKKILNKPQYRVLSKPVDSDFSSLDEKTQRYVNGQSESKPVDCDISSVKKVTLKMLSGKTAHEPPVPDISFLEKKILKKPRSRIAPQTLDSDISSENKILKAQCKAVTKPPDSDICSERQTSKTAPCRTAAEPLGSDSSGATLASAANTCTDMSRLQSQGLPSSAELCTGLSTSHGECLPLATEAHTGLSPVQIDAVERGVAINGSVDGSSSLGESISEKADEVPAKSSPSKLEMKPSAVVDLNRRTTYNTLDHEQVVEPDSMFDAFEGEPRELVAVRFHSEYSYARSLARFAASLGPIAWEIASKRIEQVLPPEVKFGPGWVGEYEPLSTPVLYVKKHQQQQLEVEQQQERQIQQQEQQMQQQQQQLQKQKQHQRRMQQQQKQQQIQQQQQQQQQQQWQIQQQQYQQQQQQQLIKQQQYQQQQQRQILQPQTVTRKDKGNEPKSKTTQNGYHKNMPFCLQSQATAVKPLIACNEVEGTNRQRTQDQKQGLFGVDLARQPAINSSMRQHQKQEVGGFSNIYNNEITAPRPQSSSETAKSKFPPIIPKERNQVQAEPQQQLQVVTPQRRNNAVGMNAAGLATWQSSDSGHSSTTTSGIIPNQQAGVHYWFAQGSQEQATNDPSRWMNSTGTNSNQSNIALVYNNNLERSMTNIFHSQRQVNPNAVSAPAWMSLGAPAEWKSVDGGSTCSKQVGSASNSAWQTPTPASRVHENARVKPETVQGGSEVSQVQNKGLVIFPQLMTTDLSRLRSPWQGLVQHTKQKDQLPPDLNISFQPPGSPARPSSGIHIDSQQPDLALQL